MNDIIRRKVAHGAAAGAEGGPGADQGWRLAFARAARDAAGLMVEVVSAQVHRRSLAELLELPPERAFLALLDGPQGGLGMLVMSAEVMSALIEMQTTGRVSAAPPMARRPTRTDAAMVAGVVDRALEELEQVLAEEADLVWAGGFRYASFLEDPRPLGLLLEDHPYRVLTTNLSLSAGARTGQLILALPADGKGQRPALRSGQAEEATPVAAGFSAELGTAVMAADCVLDAVIARLTLPLREVMALQPDQVLPLIHASLDQIGLDGIDGRRLGQARLGQHKGMRAVRLKDQPGQAPRMSTEVPEAMADAGLAPMPEVAPAFLPPAGLDDAFAGFAAPMDLGDGLLAAG